MYDQSELINLLVNHDIESFYDRGYNADSFLEYIFENGIRGYNDYEMEELINECIDKNLIEENENAEI
jgi:hypothetical protein